MSSPLTLTELIPPFAPVLCVEGSSTEPRAMEIGAEHFMFILSPDPTVKIPRFRGASILPVRLIARTEPRLCAYAVENGQGKLITDPAEVVKTTPHYVQTLDIVELCQRVGVEQFGLIRLNCDNRDRLLREWPGPVSNLVYAPTEDEQALRNMKDWYRYNDGLFVLAR